MGPGGSRRPNPPTPPPPTPPRGDALVAQGMSPTGPASWTPDWRGAGAAVPGGHPRVPRAGHRGSRSPRAGSPPWRCPAVARPALIDAAAAEVVQQQEVAAVAEAYGAEFVSRMDPVPDATATLERLSGRGFALGDLELAAGRDDRPLRRRMAGCRTCGRSSSRAARRLDQATRTDASARRRRRSG